jgi:hypothetical protein
LQFYAVLVCAAGNLPGRESVIFSKPRSLDCRQRVNKLEFGESKAGQFLGGIGWLVALVGNSGRQPLEKTDAIAIKHSMPN